MTGTLSKLKILYSKRDGPNRIIRKFLETKGIYNMKICLKFTKYNNIVVDLNLIEPCVRLMSCPFKNNYICRI